MAGKISKSAPAKVQQKKSDAPSGAFFKPQPLAAPAKGESLEKYRQYVECYKHYLTSLGSLKKEFWAGVESRQKSQQAAQKAAAVPTEDKAQATSTSGRKAKENARRRVRRREAALKREAKELRLKTEVEKLRQTYADVAAKPSAPKSKKVVPAVAPVKEQPSAKKGRPSPKPKGKGKKGDKSDGGPKGPKGPPPGPSGTGGSQDGTSKSEEGEKGPSPAKKPNRKERRRAIYGPPQGAPAALKGKEKERPESPEKEDSDDAEDPGVNQESEEEMESDASSEVAPFVNPFAPPVIGAQSRLGAVASSLGEMNDDITIKGAYPTFLTAASKAAVSGLGGVGGGYGYTESIPPPTDRSNVAFKAMSGAPLLKGRRDPPPASK